VDGARKAALVELVLLADIDDVRVVAVVHDLVNLARIDFPDVLLDLTEKLGA
jgi:hypothetical protein